MKPLRLLTAILATCAITLHATADSDAWTAADTERLVDRVRHPPLAECWAIMTGTVRHKARGQRSVKLPIQLRARFSPDRSLAQLHFNEQERYLIGQSFSEGTTGTSVIPQSEPAEDAVSLREIGIRPGDMTLSFLYWDYQGDLGEDRYKAQTCRILEFKHPEAEESARVWVSIKHGFPVRVMWYEGDAEEPYRQLEITGLKEIHDIWVVSEVRVSNPGWRTIVKFDEIKLEQTTAETPIPADLFVQ